MRLKICIQYKSENILLFMQLPELNYRSSHALMSDKVYTKHLNMVRRGDWTAACLGRIGQMCCTWLSSDWKYLLSRHQRTMNLAACPSRGATVSCQGNSCFHPPKGEITHSLHSRNSFLFLLVSVYKNQRLQNLLITTVKSATFTSTSTLLAVLYWKGTLSIFFQRRQYR